MKMGITRSPFPYDPGTYYSSRLARLRLLAISRCAKLGATVFLIPMTVRYPSIAIPPPSFRNRRDVQMSDVTTTINYSVRPKIGHGVP